MAVGLKIKAALSAALLLAGLLGCGEKQKTSSQVIGTRRTEDDSGFYKLRGQPVSWGVNIQAVTFAFDPHFPHDLRIGCTNAAETWNQAIGRELLNFDPVDRPAAGGADGHNVISFGRARKSTSDQHAAETTLSVLPGRPPRIVRVVVDFDDRRFEFGLSGRRGEVDVESACLHELGHAIGLTHVQDRRSVMAPLLALGFVKRELSSGDRERAQILYSPHPRGR